MTSASCTQYKTYGYCSRYTQVQDLCPMTCGVCSPGVKVGSPGTTCQPTSSDRTTTESLTTTTTTTTTTTKTTPLCKTASECKDSIDPLDGCAAVTLDLCKRSPGKYAVKCPKSCNNCDGTNIVSLTNNVCKSELQKTSNNIVLILVFFKKKLYY